MTTPTNCPHCGEPAVTGDSYWTEYDCGTTICTKGEEVRGEWCKVQFSLIAERAAHAETRKELEETQRKLQAARITVGEQNKKLVAACARFERLWKRYQQTEIQPPSQKAEAELAEARRDLNDYRAICFKQHALVQRHRCQFLRDNAKPCGKLAGKHKVRVFLDSSCTHGRGWCAVWACKDHEEGKYQSPNAPHEPRRE